MTFMLYARTAVALASTSALAVIVGCTGKPGVELETKADIRISQPLPVQLATSQPINVTIGGLVIEYRGTFIPEPLFSQINEGDSPEYVAAIFGSPDFESKLGDGTVVWRWKYQPLGQQGPLVSLFGNGKGDDPSPDHISALAIFKEGKLNRKWRG